jgi:DNA-binding GntR family transcriptional regulator
VPGPDSIAAALAPAQSKALADDVVDRLRRAILQGTFRPGVHLREEELAAALQVSRSPVREALLQLEREGLVLRRRHRGAMVTRLSRRDLDEVYSLRLALERLALRWATANASTEDCDRMDAAVVAIGDSIAPDISVQEAARIDLEFHDLVYQAARHERLYRTWSELRPQVHLFLLARNYVANPEFRQVMIDGHRSLVDAIRARNEDGADRIAEAHVRASYARVAESYDADERG